MPAPLHHRLQQLPALVGHQLQQSLVHRHQRHLRALRRRLAVQRALHLDAHLGLVAHPIHLAIGADAHLQLVRTPADVDLRHAHLERRLAQVHQRRGLHVRHPAAHRQHRHEDVGRMVAAHRDLHHRRLARQRHDLHVHHAFALHGHQRGGLAKRHAHLEHRRLARLVALALGQHVHAVVVGHVEPPLSLACHPHAAVGHRDCCHRHRPRAPPPAARRTPARRTRRTAAPCRRCAPRRPAASA